MLFLKPRPFQEVAVTVKHFPKSCKEGKESTSEYIGELQSSTYMHRVSPARVEVLVVGSLDQPDQRHLGACKKCRF